MRNFSKLFTLLLVLILLLQSTVISVFAVDYSYESTYSTSTYASSYNTGTRHDVCDSLSSQAQSYYTGDYAWDVMSALTGGSTDCLNTDNDLFEALNTLMSSTMTKSVTYSSLTSYWPSTDGTGSKSSTMLFYSDTTGSSFNREHVWPKSHASFEETRGGADLHHLRPTDTTVNSTRGNLIMGNVRTSSSSYKTYSYSGKTVLYYTSSTVEVNDDIKGDVARILLYVWCRWEEPNLFKDTPNPVVGANDTKNDGGKVIESLETLLEWCKNDPVDEWEMSRNDQVQNIQGNRNVFIDYPEYAWLVFGLDVPEDMTTPSSKASEGITGNGSENNGDSNNGGSNGSNGNTTVTTPEIITSPVVGTAYKFGMNQTLAGGTYYLVGGMDTKNSFYLATTNSFSSAIDVYLEETTGGYYLYTLIDGTKTYINSKEVTGTDGNLHVNGIYSTTAETVYTFDTELNTLVTKISGKTYALGTRNDKSYTTVGPCDTSNNPFMCQLYTSNSGSSGTDTPDVPDTPDTPASGYKSTFTNAVSALKDLEGEDLYLKICEAVNAYAKLTEDEKNSVQNEYSTLLSVVEDYNKDIDNITDDTLDIRFLATSVEALALYALPFAVYQLFGKKYI